jgi:hypothetical protein
MIQGSSSLTQDLLELSSQQRTKRGIDTSFETKTCSSATRKLYNLEASTQPGISLVKPPSTKVTGSRQQTAATSHRNVMSQIATLLNFNFVRGEEESCGGVMIKWLDCTSASGDLLSIVILICLGAEEMPDATSPMILMEIPGLNISSSKDIRATKTFGWVVFLKSGSSMIDFHSWYEKTILHEHWKLLREQRLKLTAHNTISDDECMQI